MPSISVIVPVYKAEDFLRRCTDSILAQSHADFELLLIDDGSPDGSGALCDAISAQDARVRVIHQENGGVSAARNCGIETAEGTYLAFADADDYLAPDALEKLYKALTENEADSAGCAHFKLFENGETEIERAALPDGVHDKAAIDEGIVCRLLGERLGRGDEILNGFVWRFLFSAALIAQNNLRFVGAYLEDEIFLMEYFCHAQKLAIIDEPLYYYLQNSLSVTRNYLPDYMETFTRFMKQKDELVARFDLGAARPAWRENSNWSGLLIAVGNEYAPGNTKSAAEKKEAVREICKRSEMRRAMRKLRPQGLSRNKQIVVELLRRRLFWLLGLLYAFKNRKS